MNNNSTYRRLGDYIREVDVRNTDLNVNKLVGLTIAKAFIPSVANTIGTDLSKYKIIKENQFACSLMQVSRDGKMPIAIYKGENAIMSPAYPVFEICNNELLPDYLHMWFSRSEFDREAVFYAVGGVRGSLDWNDFMDMQLPVPSIEEQRRIVARYQAIQNRIANNKQTIAKLEEAAQALYRKMFVDGIDVENLPEGWRMGTLGEVAEILDYRRKPLSFEERAEIKGDYPYYGAMSIVDYIDSFLFDGIYLLLSEDGANVVDENGFPALQYVYGKFWLNNHAHILQGKGDLSTEYLYLALKKKNVADLVTGAAQPKINQENMCSIEILVPEDKVLKIFNEKVLPIFSMIRTKEQENNKLTEMLSLVMAEI